MASGLQEGQQYSLFPLAPSITTIDRPGVECVWWGERPLCSPGASNLAKHWSWVSGLVWDEGIRPCPKVRHDRVKINIQTGEYKARKWDWYQESLAWDNLVFHFATVCVFAWDHPLLSSVRYAFLHGFEGYLALRIKEHTAVGALPSLDGQMTGNFGGLELCLTDSYSFTSVLFLPHYICPVEIILLLPVWKLNPSEFSGHSSIWESSVIF